ncbi:MAG: hypothetical protein MMC33_001810 [Icmadophila ericetorum]|nr:hypothetical protein [Icmadophila ericetorum]
MLRHCLHPNGSQSPVALLDDLLTFLATIALIIPDYLVGYSFVYYGTISKVIRFYHRSPSCFCNIELIKKATTALLGQSIHVPSTLYEALLCELLTIPYLQDILGNLEFLSRVLDAERLAATLKQILALDPDHNLVISRPREEVLWLLSYFIYTFRTRSGDVPDRPPTANYIIVVSNLLTYLAKDITPRISVLENSSETPLPNFVSFEILTLVDQRNVTSLLARSEFTGFADRSENDSTQNTVAVASFALALLRVFPQKGDDIRMWLYLGSTFMRSDARTQNKIRVPAIKYFWNTISQTSVYHLIRQHPSNAVNLLRPNESDSNTSHRAMQQLKKQEWKTILLFLELYTFVLKVTDDEEFISGSSHVDESQSWTRQSALEIASVEKLVVFLKNLAFATYWNGAQILGSDRFVETPSLASYFGLNEVGPSTKPTEVAVAKLKETDISALDGTSLQSLKSLVTGLLRMIYERDSRRRFLPKDHWLMTAYFDMDGFIQAVDVEEDYRLQLQEAGDQDEGEQAAEDDESYNDEEILVGANRTIQIRRHELLKQNQQKIAREKNLKAMTPRLEILQNMPFFIPFNTRVAIFHIFIRKDQLKRRDGYLDSDQWRFARMHSTVGGQPTRQNPQEILRKYHAKIRRDSCFDDAYDHFYSLGESLKEPIQITFVDQFDTVEAGIDGGGVTKEFLTSVTNEAFSPSAALDLFVENDQHLLYPNPAAIDERRDLLRQAGIKENTPEWNEPIRDLLHRYEFLGRVIGKCLYEGILVDIHFAPFFLVKWALSGGAGSATNESNYRANINDLRDLDETLYQGLLKLKNYPGNVEDFCLDFTVTDTISSPLDGSGQRTITRELRPGGSEIAVTNANRLVYITYMARHRLQIQPRLQTDAFLRGLGLMIPPSWLSMFNQSELQTLLGGDASEIDVQDLRKNTLYGGVYVIGNDGLEHPTVTMFWEVMQAYSDADRRKVLKYVTSTPRSPLLGFDKLNPRFSIRDSGADQTRLPSASTCVNLLKLPIYQHKDVLRQKLTYAINAGAGFNLS